MGKEKVKRLWGENFKDFAINGIRAMAILLILFCMLGVIFMVFYFLPHGSENLSINS